MSGWRRVQNEEEAAAIAYATERQFFYESAAYELKGDRSVRHWVGRMEDVAHTFEVSVKSIRELLKQRNLPLLLGIDPVMDRYIARRFK